MTSRPTVVIGATRGTGAHVVRLLSAHGRPVHIGARNPARARALFGPTVPVVEVDLARPSGSLDELMRGAHHVVFTAGVPPGLSGEARIKAVDYGGVAAAVEAATRAGLPGRFLYMTTMGLHHRGGLIAVLNTIKRNLVKWRLEAEQAVLGSRLEGAVIRAGVLTDGRAGTRRLELHRGDRPISMGTTVSRADVAALLVAALEAPALPRDVSVFSAAGQPRPAGELLAELGAPAAVTS